MAVGTNTKLDFTEFFNVIDGKLETTKETARGVNPSTLEKMPSVPVSTPEDVDRAVQAAKRVSGAWADVPYKERQAIVAKFADGIASIQEDLTVLLTKKQGKALQLAHVEIGMAIQFLQGYAQLADPEEVIEDKPGRRVVTKYVPLGVAVGIVPWNSPVFLGKVYGIYSNWSEGPAERCWNSSVGGNDPAIVCSDVNLKKVAPKFAMAALANSGQLCIAIKRIYVHESIYDGLLEAIAVTVKSLPVGDGLESSTLMGPVQNHLQFDRVKSLLADIQSHNLKLAAGSIRPSDAGKEYFITPTVVDNPPDASRIVVEEPFGPVFPVLKWKDEDEVLRRANDIPMGLGASIWTPDLVKAERLAAKLKAGTGGIGAEHDLEGIKSYCNTKSVFVNAA
ncbi:Aldehyde/histidinol dehydrogenase [Fusarium redolens]|uniref:aldehyde dehydrogenase (NAD(+)) n=1 Tax=Fusarium redolens TaxID=48865 RepID=A0A9P9FZ76_FUSRE|nr:Aldehyde/histidinol dehydrogenase [Fusarium redolens]KAH7227159.1 Aldehyde/histidinol dehydrogenase [Fusarium redolens]